MYDGYSFYKDTNVDRHSLRDTLRALLAATAHMARIARADGYAAGVIEGRLQILKELGNAVGVDLNMTKAQEFIRDQASHLLPVQQPTGETELSPWLVGITTDRR